MAPSLNPHTINDERRPTVFISYHRASGGAFSQQLIAALTAAGHAHWIDQSEVEGGQDWARLIPVALRNASAMVVIVTAQALTRDWVRTEIQWARKQFDRRQPKPPIIPLLLEDVAYTDDYFVLEGPTPIEFFNCDQARALEKLLRALPPASVSVVPTEIAAPRPANLRQLEEAYLDRLSISELRIAEKYTPLGGASQQLVRRVEMPALYEHLPPLGKDRQRPVEAAALEQLEPRRFDDAVTEILKLRRAVLLGEPGGGKTTTLWKLAAKLVTQAMADPTQPIPLFIRLKEWTTAGQSLLAFMAAQLGELGLHLKQLLDNGRAALLLDGLNELPVEERKEKYEAVQQFIEAHPDLLAVVSCRELDYTIDLGFDRITVMPLEAEGIQTFARNYLGAEKGAALFWELLGGAATRAVWEVWQKAEASFDQFLHAPDIPKENPNVYGATSVEHDRVWKEKVRGPQSLLALARNPYMMWMLTRVYLRRGTLPDNRGDLFREFVEELFNEREKLTADEQLALTQGLARVAFEMQTKALTVLPDHRVLTLLGERLLKQAGSASLLMLGAQVQFTHQLLQEYFAAQYLRNAINDEGKQAASIWKPENWWERNNWEEAAVLLAGLASDDCTNVLEWLADANPEVAAQCIVRSGAHTPDATRARLSDLWLKRLTDLKNDKSPLARAAVGRALGLANLDNRKGVGIFRHNGIDLPNLELKQIPADKKFQYGHKDESDSPPQTISLDGFYISRFPVTVAQFQTFVADAEGASQKRWYEGLKATDDDREIRAPYFNYFNHAYANHPRESVNWYQAVAFTRWLAWRYGLQPDELRLPTEFEWEKAARGTDGRLYPYKGKYDTTKANTERTIGQTSAVGIFPQGASPYGVEEMSGNVWEWCLSNYDNPAREARDEDLNTEQSRVLRGGSWGYDSVIARAAYRYYLLPALRLDGVGFRMVGLRPPSFLL